MSKNQQPQPQSGQPQPQNHQQAQPAANGQQLSQQDRRVYQQMLATLSRMNKKIEKGRQRLSNDKIAQKKSKASQMSDRLIQSKQSSEIITKQNLLTDITQTYEKAVVEVYSQNSKLQKQMTQMATLIKHQNTKILAHAQREKDLVAQNQELREQLNRLKDQKLLLARGGPLPSNNEGREKVVREKNQGGKEGQQQDFDFWSMPQDNYGKKKKQFVQDSNLWVNQKGSQNGLFLTQDRPVQKRRR